MNNDPLDDIHMLNNPLTTEDGFLNEACVNELAGALRAFDVTHERPELVANPEWSTKRWTSLGDVIGAFAAAVISCFCDVPPNFAEVVGMLRECARREMREESGVELGELSLLDVSRILHESVFDLPQFQEWNDEAKVGKHWLDLVAVVQNTCVHVRNDRREFDRFNAEFEAKHAKDGEASR